MIRSHFGVSRVRVSGRLVMALAFVFVVSPYVVAQENSPQEVPLTTLETVLEKYGERGREKWEQKIKLLEERNVAEGAWPADSLLFFGSSSFRRWETMNADMVPYPSINRGYGGAKYVDMVLFAERMLKPHQYRALLLFSANDVKGEAADSSPEEVECAVREIIRISKAHLPEAPIFIVEVTPTESRFDVWEQTRKINATLREIALSTDNTWCITTAEHYLEADGTPKTEYFVDDKLHLNELGYKKWAALIKFSLDSFIPAAKN